MRLQLGLAKFANKYNAIQNSAMLAGNPLRLNMLIRIKQGIYPGLFYSGWGNSATFMDAELPAD